MGETEKLKEIITTLEEGSRDNADIIIGLNGGFFAKKLPGSFPAQEPVSAEDLARAAETFSDNKKLSPSPAS